MDPVPQLLDLDGWRIRPVPLDPPDTPGQSQRPADVAQRIRGAIKAARAAADLYVPDGAKISVTTDRWSTGAAIRVAVSDYPPSYPVCNAATHLARLVQHAAGSWILPPHATSHFAAVSAGYDIPERRRLRPTGNDDAMMPGQAAWRAAQETKRQGART